MIKNLSFSDFIAYTLFLILFFFFSFKSVGQVKADFIADTTSGCGLVNVKFTNTSTGNNLSYFWDFGNGNSSTQKDPTATYLQAGKYNVKLVVSDGNGLDSLIKTNYIEVFGLPIPDFTYDPKLGCAPLIVNFKSTSTTNSSGFKSFKWDFSDGSQAGSGQNTYHEYLTSGNYAPSLEVEDNNGCKNIIAKPAIVVFDQAKALFNSSNSPISCDSIHTVNFINQSTGTGLSYFWDFGDGKTSTETNPKHTYNGLGTYDVRLIVISANCSDTLLIKNFVRLEKSKALFEFATDSICLGASFLVTNKSEGARTYTWDFGDGNSSSFTEPAYTYKSPGWHKVKLTVSAGSACSSTYTDSIYVEELIANFITDKHNFCDPYNNFIFTASSNIPADYFWRIGSYSNISDTIKTSFKEEGSPLHYTENGNYKHKTFYFDDTLIAISPLGCRDTVLADTNRIHNGIIASIHQKIITFDHSGFCIPDSVMIEDSSFSKYPITSYEWTVDSIKYYQNPPFLLNLDTPYTEIMLKITDSLGCTDSAKINIPVGSIQTPKFSFYPDTLCPTDTLFIINESFDKNFITETEYYITYRGNLIKIVQDNKDTVKVPMGDFNNIGGGHGIMMNISSNGCDTNTVDTINTFFVHGPYVKITHQINNCDTSNYRSIKFYSAALDVTRFYWDFGDGSPIDSVNINPVHTYPKDSIYEVKLLVFNDSSPCSSSTAIDTISITPVPPVSITSSRYSYCLGDTAHFIFQNANYYDSINWYMNNKFVTNQYSFDHIFDSSGIYFVELDAVNGGCRTKRLDTVIVSQPIAKVGYEIIDACLPTIVQFTDSSNSKYGIRDRLWTFGNGDSSTQRTELITYYTAGSRDVYLWIEDTLGCVDSVLLKGLIKSSPLSVDFTADKRTICTGDSVSFRNLSTGDATFFSWRFGDGDTLHSLDEFVGHRFLTAGEFTVELFGRNDDSCEISNPKVEYIKVEETPVAAFTADTTHANCYPLEVNFQDQSTGNITEWYWDFGDNNTSAIQHPYHNYIANGNFNVFLRVKTSYGCSDSVSMGEFIKINAPNADIILDKDSACIHDIINFKAENPTGVTDVYWDFGDGSGSRDYVTSHAYDRVGLHYLYLTLRDSTTNCNVKVMDSIYIFDNKAEFILNEDTACQPFNAVFQNNSTGADRFTWDFGDGNTNSNDFNPTHLYSQAGSYTISLKIESNIGCKDTARQNLLVNPKPKVSYTSDQEICIGDSVILEASGGMRYSWFPFNSLTDSSSATQKAIPDTTTLYQVIAFNEFNCSDTGFIKVKVQQAPIAIPKGSLDTTIIIGEKVELNVYAGLGFYYQWTPSLGLSCDDCYNPIARPLQSTSYIVRIADSLGCFEIFDTIYIEVEEKYSVDVPNTFTPNGDGTNDVIYANGWGLKELLYFKIYNRFGEKVFESKDFDDGWDGIYKNKPQPIETYVYVVEALTYSGKVISKRGTINLLR